MRLQQISTLLNLDNVSGLCSVLFFYRSNFITGGGCGRVLQRFWHCMETQSTGSDVHRWLAGMTLRAPNPIKHVEIQKAANLYPRRSASSLA